jgi:putative methionine-R-sulfoxide reductase with GAF domain
VTASGGRDLGRQFTAALETIRGLVDSEPEPDEALRRSIALLAERIPRFAWIGLYFVEDGQLVLGPHAGAPANEEPRPPADTASLRAAVASGNSQSNPCSIAAVPVLVDGSPVAVLGVQSEDAALGPDDVAFLERVAELVSPHCLVGWDTGGVPWSDTG